MTPRLHNPPAAGTGPHSRFLDRHQRGACELITRKAKASVDSRVAAEAAVAVDELRLFIGLYEHVQVVPGSRIARKLEAARKAVAAYEQIEILQSRESA